MKKEKTKNKSWYKQWWAIVLFVVVGFIIIFPFFKSNPSNDTNSKLSDTKELSEIKKVAGLNDKVKIGNLSFRLFGVTLKKWDEKEDYILLWNFEVINNGETIENVSDCGTLLFEDDSQYTSVITKGGYIFEVSSKCGYSEIVPGARISTGGNFYFSNNHPSYYEGNVKSLKEVPGSKITFFSQQNQGLVKVTFDNSEIIYSNESVNLNDARIKQETPQEFEEIYQKVLQEYARRS